MSAFFTDTVQQLPGQVRDVMADPETRDRLHRMPAADAFRELERLLGLMQFTVLQAWGFDDEPAQAVYETIDTLATLPTDPHPSDVNRAREPSTGGFQRAFVEIERMALDFERRKAQEAMRAARGRREQTANVATPPVLATGAVRERPRERRDGQARRSPRAGPSDDEGLAEPEGRDNESRPRDLLFTDARQYLARLGSAGAERDWLVEQIASLGYSRERVGAALAVLCSEGLARRGRGDDGETVVWGEL